LVVDIKGVGPLVTGSQVEKLYTERTGRDGEGKPENALELMTTGSANANITHRLKGGKLGALLEVRDKTVSRVLERLDDLAFNLTKAVNQIHGQGVTRTGHRG